MLLEIHGAYFTNAVVDGSRLRLLIGPHFFFDEFFRQAPRWVHGERVQKEAMKDQGEVYDVGSEILSSGWARCGDYQ